MNIPAVIPHWKEVVPPPPPYLFALRRTFSGGVHVLILARETGAGKIHVESAMDNGTIATGGSFAEGSVEQENDAAALILKVCERWEKSQATRALGEPRKRRQYHYVLEKGGIGGPVYREGLYDLLAAGKLSWESQVWDDIPHGMGGGRAADWLPIRRLLGVPSTN